MALVHLAVKWPSGLKILIEKRVNINAEDHCGRRPIHFAISQGSVESVKLLIEADCALFTPKNVMSLLHFAWGRIESNGQHLLDLLVPALINRHTRLLDLAEDLLPGSIFSKFQTRTVPKSARNAPDLIELLVSQGICIPEALQLDGKSFFHVSEGFWLQQPIKKMTSVHLDLFWDAGFKDINYPDDVGYTPMLQSWLYGDLEMVAWLADKSVPLSSKHRDFPLTGLHLLAKCVERCFDDQCRVMCQQVERSPAIRHCIGQIQEELQIPYDECTCLCSPDGCSPIKFLFQNSYSRDYEISSRDRYRNWLKLLEPRPKILQKYTFHFTRLLLFRFLGGRHACCVIGYKGYVSTKSRVGLGLDHVDCDEHCHKWTWWIQQEAHQLCLDGIPMPRRSATPSPKNDEELKVALDLLMSHYDDIPQRDSAPPEEQPFSFLTWLIAERYLVVETEPHCPRCSPEAFDEAQMRRGPTSQAGSAVAIGRDRVQTREIRLQLCCSLSIGSIHAVGDQCNYLPMYESIKNHSHMIHSRSHELAL